MSHADLPESIASIDAEVPQITYDSTGGGLYRSETDVKTKEQADHDLTHGLIQTEAVIVCRGERAVVLYAHGCSSATAPIRRSPSPRARSAWLAQDAAEDVPALGRILGVCAVVAALIEHDSLQTREQPIELGA